MSHLSRRDFFFRFGHTLTDQIDLSAVQTLIPRSSNPNPKAKEPEWIAVGKISDMRPGTNISIVVTGETLILRADGEGVWLTTEKPVEKKRRLAIRLGPGGIILANLDLEWPKNRILSHSSGESKDLTDEKLERSSTAE